MLLISKYIYYEVADKCNQFLVALNSTKQLPWLKFYIMFCTLGECIYKKKLNRFKFVFHHALRCTKKIIEKHPATHDIVMSDGGVCMMRPNDGYKGDD